MAFMKEGYLLASVFEDKTLFSRVTGVEPTPYNAFPVSATAIPAGGTLEDVELILNNNKLLTISEVTSPLRILDVMFGIPTGIRMFRKYPASTDRRGKPYNFPFPTLDAEYGYWDSAISPLATPTDATEMYFYPIVYSNFSFKNVSTAAITLTLNVQIHECIVKQLSPTSAEDMRFISKTIAEWYKNPANQIFRIDKVGGNSSNPTMPEKLSEVVENISLEEVI